QDGRSRDLWWLRRQGVQVGDVLDLQAQDRFPDADDIPRLQGVGGDGPFVDEGAAVALQVGEHELAAEHVDPAMDPGNVPVTEARGGLSPAANEQGSAIRQRDDTSPVGTGDDE